MMQPRRMQTNKWQKYFRWTHRSSATAASVLGYPEGQATHGSSGN